MTAKDAQYLEARKLTREEVAAAYHIPLPFVGILDHATFSNITEQHKNLYQDTLGPLLERVQQEFELQLLGDFADLADAYFEFNLAEKLKGTPEEQASSMSTLVGAPVMTVNEGRARLNLPRIDDAAADTVIVPLNVTQGGQASPQDSAPPKAIGVLRTKVVRPWTVKARASGEVDRHTKALERFFERQGKAVVAKLGAAKGRKAAVGDVFDGDRWDRELGADMFKLNTATAKAAAALAAAALEVDDFDDDVMTAWLEANASGVASGVNGTTRALLDEALGADDPVEAVKHLFEVAVAARAGQIAATQVTAVSGFASKEVAQAGGFVSKQWVVASANPRPSHAAMDGETVDVDGVFSNGARWPGDSSLADDERAGCTCDLAFVKE
jgi:hypothetical protein